MSLEGIREFIKNAIPQIAAMDGETGKLGDSQREISIMNRLLADASQEEKDFVQKYLDGEPIAEPQQKNDKAVVSYSSGGLDIQDNDNQVARIMKQAVRYEVQYDKDGQYMPITVYYNDKDEIIGRDWTNKKGEVTKFEHTSTLEDGTEYNLKAVEGSQYQTWTKSKDDFSFQYDNSKRRQLLFFKSPDGECSVAIRHSFFQDGAKVYEVKDGTVNIPKKVFKKFPEVKLLLEKECGLKVAIE